MISETHTIGKLYILVPKCFRTFLFGLLVNFSRVPVVTFFWKYPQGLVGHFFMWRELDRHVEVFERLSVILCC